MKSADNASPTATVAADRASAAATQASAPRIAKHYRVSEDFSTMRAEIERQRQELNQCRATIGELKRLAAEAAAASAAKADLLAEMSHELRTPLNAIIGFSEVMQSGAFGPIGHPSYRSYLDDMIFCGRHMLGIVDDALDLARHEAGQMALKEELVALDAVIDEALRLIAPMAQRAGVALAGLPAAAASHLPRLYCDPRRVRQILLNVLANAVKFTEPGGQVQIAVDFSGDLAIVISDTGVGIEPDAIPIALSRFGQVATNEPRHRDGAGLGLTLAKALAEQHGGILSLRSSAGSGTVVRISFPAGRVAASDPHNCAAELPTG
ncbi:MAG TPA: HAMP domain-containing sensor histidine kinase [Stellaceae bacterium]|jgi:signal transduction histidine kinase